MRAAPERPGGRRRGRARAIAVIGVVALLAACGSRADQAQVAEALGTGRTGTNVAATKSGTAANPTGVASSGTAAAASTGADGSVTGASGDTGTSGDTGVLGGDTTAASLPPGGNGGATDVGVTADSLTVANISIVGGPVPGLFKGAQDGMDAFLAYVNSQGGVYGRKLKALNQDDGFDCSQNKQLAADDVDKAFAFVGSFSLFDDCSNDVLLQHPDVPDVHVALGPSAQANPSNFPAAPVRNGAATGPFDYIKAKYPDAITASASIIGDVDSAKAAWANTKNTMESVGYKFVYERIYEPTETDFTADIIRMKTSNPPVQLLTLSSADVKAMARIMKAAASQNWHPQVALLGAAGYDSTLIPIAGGPEALEGAWLYLPTSMYLGEDRADVPEVDLYLTWLNKVHPQAKPDLFSVYGWESARLFVQALQAAGPEAKRATTMAALKAITSFDGNGMLAPGNPGEKGPATCYIMVQVQGGQFVRQDSPTGQFRCDGTYVYRGQ